MISLARQTPRKRHTKSRTGCKECKRRHIRCDETSPQCNNCTKYNARCPYLGILEKEQQEQIPKKPNLLWNSEIEAEIRIWQRTGKPPFPSTHIFSAIPLEHFSFDDLRLIHHVASISSELRTHDSSNFTIWVRQVLLFLEIGVMYNFVMHSLLALSASHLAWLTKSPPTANMAFEHRGIAFKGLHEAIGKFSRENSDAVLAASLLLSWQATERDWTHLMRGTSSIIDAMQPWKSESRFEDFIAERGTFPTAPPSPDVATYLKKDKEGYEAITQLISFIQEVQSLSPNYTTTQRFDMLDRLRTWLLWLPVKYLQETQIALSTFVVLAYYYTVALIVEPLFPEIGAAYFGSLSLNPIEAIARRLSNDVPQTSQVDLHTALSFMAYPIDMANQFRVRMGLVPPERMAMARETQ